MKYDGKTTPEEAAVRILDAERSLKARAVQDLQDDAPQPIDGQFSQDNLAETIPQKRDRLVEETMKLRGCDYKTALIAVSKESPELFESVHR